MPIDIVWHDEANHILRWNFHGAIQSEDMWTSQDKTFALIEQHGQDVDLIVHVADDMKMPSNFMSTLSSSYRRVESRGNTDQTLTVLVGTSMFAKSFMSIYNRLNPNSAWQMVDTIEEAEAMIFAAREKRQADE